MMICHIRSVKPTTKREGYYIEHNGDCWQSVFPSWEADKSQLHSTIKDAEDYMIECGVNPTLIVILL